MTSYQERIEQAHKDGHLFAHMFEAGVEKFGVAEKSPYSIKNLFDVMAKKPDARYENAFQHDFPVTEHGIMGLPTTALKKEFPVRLFHDASYVGLLMDRAKPVVVNPYDGFTMVNGGDINFTIYDGPHSVFSPQHITRQTGNLDMTDDIQSRFAGAKIALDAMWNYIRTSGWDWYMAKAKAYPGMNEVNVAAGLNDVCGIVVYNDKTSSTRFIAGDKKVNFADSVKAACDIRDYLTANYPDAFPVPLPIVCYELSRSLEMPEGKPAIHTLSERQIDEIIAKQANSVTATR